MNTRKLRFFGAVVILGAGLIIGGVLRHRTSPRDATPPTANAAEAQVGASKVAVDGKQGSKLSEARQLDPAINPYAGTLRQPGISRRIWDTQFLTRLQDSAGGQPIEFELTDGVMASGTVRIVQRTAGELTYLSGDLTAPEAGKFFFLKPPLEGKAGKAVGVVEFPASKTAYRIEPTGPNGDPELWKRRLDEVICLNLPPREPASAQTLDAEEMPPLRPDIGPEYVPAYNSNIVSLQSYPGSRAVLLLDFFGGYTPTWGGIAYARPNVSNASIRDLWKRVAEDYMPFNINVTTDIKVYLAAPANSRQRCCFTTTPVTAAGVAYLGSWNWGSDTPCWSVYNSGKSGAEVGAHEPGHTLGLSHQGTATEEYYGGQGSGATGWAPIMGVGYYQPVSTWAKGEYLNANQKEDELAMITTQNNNVTYRADDTGSTLATSRYLEVYADSSAFAEGVIERTGDVDAFQFTTSGGQVLLAANPVGDWANLALSIALADASGTVLASNSPQTTLSATVNTTVAAGTYTVQVAGAPRNNVLTNGFSAYGSLGYYSVAGSVAGARLPTRLSILEKSPNGTSVGTVPASDTNSSLAYSIVSGNTGNTFSIDAGGVVWVANNTLLDYTRLATNTMLAVQFELLVNITNLANSSLTELNRRVVIAVRQAGGDYPIAVSGFNASVIVPCNATAATPRATAFDVPNNWAFYEAGLNANPQAGGSMGGQGLPANGVIISQTDGTTFQLAPAGAANALRLGYNNPSYGTLTLATPAAYNSIAILASSANGGGLGTLVLQFTNGARSQVFTFNAQDWYNTTANVAAQGFGRVRLGQSTLSTEDAGGTNPNLYQTTINLAALGLNLPISSISFTNTTAGGSQTCAILAVSGEAMAPQVNIAQQPQSVTNNVPAQGATFRVVAMGAPPLAYQWSYSASGAAGTYTPLANQTASNLVLNAVLQPPQAGSYQVVVANGFGAVTSSAATLTVQRAPAIVQQPSPANLTLFAGVSNTLSVVASGALPMTYSWRTNGVPVSGATSPSYTINSVQVSQSANYTVVVGNSYGSVTSSVVALTVLASPSYPYAQTVLNDRPLGYWRLNETSGTVAFDQAAGKNGIYNRVLLGQPGYNLVDTHLSARFGYLAANTSLVTNIPIDFATSGSATFTVEAWVNGGGQTSDSGLVSKGTGSGGEQFNLDCGGANRGFRFFVRDITGAAHVASSSVAPNNQWRHVVGVCDQARSNILLYVDGVIAATNSIIPGSGLLGSANPVTIGCRQSGTTAYDFQFVGFMEEVAIYNYALSAAQVQAHYSQATNRAPVFAVEPFSKPAATAGVLYSSSIAASAADPNGDSVTYAKISGPAWLSVAGNGVISGRPLSANVGNSAFSIRATDPAGLFDTATMTIPVLAAPSLIAGVSPQGADLLVWWSGGVSPYSIQMTTNTDTPIWETVASGLTATNLVVPRTNSAAFYRIQGL